MNHIKPNNEKLIETLFDDMKKMDSVNKRLQGEINDLRVKLENVPDDMRMMNSHVEKLTREVNDLRNQLREMKEERRMEPHLMVHR